MGLDYEIGKKIAISFDEWRRNKKLENFVLSYGIGYSADYKELADNINFNKNLGFIGYKYLQINGIGLKEDKELESYFKEVKDAGLEYIDTTFYGLPYFHDQFASRKNDFEYLIKIIEKANKHDINIQLTIPIFEYNKDQINELLTILYKHISEETKYYIFLQDYRGYGENLENSRLRYSSYLKLPDNIKNHININKYKTESEWIEINQWSILNNRNLILSLTPDIYKIIENKNCEGIYNYLIELDEKYYSLFPSMNELAKLYGNNSNEKLYKERDLCWKWQKQYIKERRINIHDVIDERLSGSIRY
jgi:MoaA/NifB/PqqE/SkfB family radical SAM enzyme